MCENVQQFDSVCAGGSFVLDGRRFKSCPADHEKQQVRRLKCLAFFSACAKRVQKLSAQNKKTLPRPKARERKFLFLSPFHECVSIFPSTCER